MFDYRKKLGLLALASAVAAFSGCGGDAGDQSDLLVCDDGLVPVGGQCSVRPDLVCDEGFVRNDAGDQCVQLGNPDPVYFPAADEAVIYYNRAHVDGAYPYQLHLFNNATCDGWASSSIDGVNIPTNWNAGPTPNGADFLDIRTWSDGNSDGQIDQAVAAGWTTTDPQRLAEITDDGLDPIYGAFWVVKINPAASCANYIVVTQPATDAGKVYPNDLVMRLDGTGRYARMVFLIDGLTAGPSQVPICINNECVPFEPPRRTIADQTAHFLKAPAADGSEPGYLVWDIDPATVEGVTQAELYASSYGNLDTNDEGAIVDVDSDGNEIPGTVVADLNEVSTTVLDAEFPHLAGRTVFEVTLRSGVSIHNLVRQQLLATAVLDQMEEIVVTPDNPDTPDVNEEVTEERNVWVGTGVQIGDLLDDLYTSGDADADESTTLGAVYSEAGALASVSVWAPSATGVDLQIYSTNSATNRKFVAASLAMTRDNATGIWTYSGSDLNSYNGFLYRFRVRAFNPDEGRFIRQEVNDPYSVSVTTDGEWSRFVNLASAAVKPEGWDEHTVPTVNSMTEAVIYEAHVRDFSARDESTSDDNRGKFLAFTEEGTAPTDHLLGLAEAGVTHIHLLPFFDIASVDEDASERVEITDTVADFCAVVGTSNPACDPDSDAYITDRQATFISVMTQAITDETPEIDRIVAQLIAFADLYCSTETVNYPWGPDDEENPTPAEEACYGEDNLYDQIAGIVEVGLEELAVQAINNLVRDYDSFNWGYDPHHFNVPEGSYASNPEDTSRILEARAMVQSLHEMGFRVVMDVVYNHMSASNLSAKSTFNKIVPGYYFRRNTEDGTVQGNTCCQDTAPERAMMDKFIDDSLVMWAQQYGIDGFRFDLMGYHPKAQIEDALAKVAAVDEDTYFYGEGWTPAIGDSRFEAAEQYSMAGTNVGTFNDKTMRDQARNLNLFKGDNDGAVNALRVGLAGNLADYQVLQLDGNPAAGSSFGAYGLSPLDTINYVEVHDGYTFWDQLHTEGNYDYLVQDEPFLGVRRLSTMDRVRLHSMNLSMVLLAQGVPIIHMGSELLRSKSMDHNSYNSGDWFNYVDFTQSTNNWAVGFAPDANSEHNARVFGDVNARPTSAHIAYSLAKFKEFVQIGTSPLFSLQTAADVQDRVDFYNVGENLIAMGISDPAGGPVDLEVGINGYLVLFNGSPNEQTVQIDGLNNYRIHPVLAEGVDEEALSVSPIAYPYEGSFTVPGYTTLVFEQPVGYTAPPPPSGQVGPLGSTPVFLRGSMNGWSDPAPEEQEFVFLGRNKYGFSLVLDADTYSFKVASQDWSTVDLGGTASGVSVAVDGAAVTLGAVPDNNLSLTVAEDDTTLFFLLDATDINAIQLSVETLPYAADIFVRGAMNGWSDPAPAENQLTYEGEGIYRGSVPIAADGTYGFKIASQDWSTVDFGGTAAGVSVTFGTPVTLGQVPDNNLGGTFMEGDYLFTLDASTPAAPVLTVVRDDPYAGTPIFVRGSMNGWSDPAPATNELVFVGRGVYAADIPIDNASDPSSYSFKVATQDWSTIDLGGTASGVSVVLNGDSVTLGSVPDNNLSISIPADGTYRFSVDVSSGTSELSVNAIAP